MSKVNVGVPVEYKVLVLLDKVKETTESGLILKAQTTQEKELLQSVSGIIKAVGGNSFEDWRGIIPEVGDRIMFAKNAGYIWKDKDENDYRVINDKEIVMIIPSELD